LWRQMVRAQQSIICLNPIFGGIFVEEKRVDLEISLLKVLELPDKDQVPSLEGELQNLHRSWLGQRRREESVAGLGILGVNESRQHYLELPDKELGNGQEVDPELVEAIAEVVLREMVHHPGLPIALFTLGEGGFDGHDDHKATHHAAVSVARLLLKQGIDVELFALDGNRTYDETDGLWLEADPGEVVDAIAQHRTHFAPSEERDSIEPTDRLILSGLPPEYWHLIRGQFYKLVTGDRRADEIDVTGRETLHLAVA
jgi:LmbE family N-acetylglucosaminyl deacetylase